jgi:hypothetical protein
MSPIVVNIFGFIWEDNEIIVKQSFLFNRIGKYQKI